MKHLAGALHIPDEKSIEMVYRLLDEEGIYVGASSSLNVVAAQQLALKKGPGECFSMLVSTLQLIASIFTSQGKLSLPFCAMVLIGELIALFRLKLANRSLPNTLQISNKVVFAKVARVQRIGDGHT